MSKTNTCAVDSIRQGMSALFGLRSNGVLNLQAAGEVSSTGSKGTPPAGSCFTHGLHRALQLHPDKVATICNGRAQTFATVADRVARIAGGLRGLGIGKGDVVGVLALNSDRYLEYYLAVPWVGAMVNPINFRWSAEEVAYCLNDSDCKVLFVDDMFAPMVPALRAASRPLSHVVFMGDGALPDGCIALDELIARSEPLKDAQAGDDETFGIFYTGGTTGRSKGVMLSHRNIIASGFGFLAEGVFGQGAVGLHAAPMFHLADLMTTICLLQRGGTHVMLPAFDPKAVAALIVAHGITDLLMVPVMVQKCISSPEFLNADKSSLRALLYGASPAPQALLDQVLEVLPGVALMQVYGMTETAASNTMLRAADHDPATRVEARMRSAGFSFLHTIVRIVGHDGQELPRGVVGEITVSGPNVMQGYWKLPEATAHSLRNGWVWTGDVGYMDEHGYVYIVDRSKDMIITGGENVYSIEVENVVASHPSVSSCAVIGIPSEEWGEAVHAFIVLRQGAGLNHDELVSYCRGKIAGYKIPRSLTVVEGLPVSAAGKVLKTELRKSYWTGRSRAVN